MIGIILRLSDQYSWLEQEWLKKYCYRFHQILIVFVPCDWKYHPRTQVELGWLLLVHLLQLVCYRFHQRPIATEKFHYSWCLGLVAAVDAAKANKLSKLGKRNWLFKLYHSSNLKLLLNESSLGCISRSCACGCIRYRHTTIQWSNTSTTLWLLISNC